MAKAGRGSPAFLLRFPDGMRDEIAKLADKSGRSMNSEIVAAIDAHLKGWDRLSDIEFRLKKLEASRK